MCATIQGFQQADHVMDWHLLESIFPLSILSTGGAGSLDGKPDSSPSRTWWIGRAGLGLYQGRENSEAFIYMIYRAVFASEARVNERRQLPR